MAISGDIAKMYWEVELAEPDRSLHRFLWRKHPLDPIVDYEMKRVTFGVAASPYLAVKTLQQTAGSTCPLASYHIVESFYVDDLLAGANSAAEALELYTSLRQLLTKGGFNLCKWRSSSNMVTQAIHPDLREKLPIKTLTDVHASTHPKALGLGCNSDSDTMFTSLNLAPTCTPTKRGIIADVAKTFDVLGWISPCIVVMKIMYQQLWEEELGWDEEIPKHFQDHHKLWKTQLPLLSDRRLPRCYYRVDCPYTSIHIHGFSDASEKAYSAVMYIRSTYANHPPLVSLVSSKTKVAPIKSMSIPRLELCGAGLLAKLVTSVHLALNLPLSSVTAWCDSTIVLAWLDGSSKRYKTFVGSRISTTLKLIPADQWLHIPTNHNPADCASRGIMPAELVDHTLWWEGPTWLSLDPIQVPPQPSLGNVDALELKLAVCHVLIPAPPELVEDKFECYHKTLSVTAGTSCTSITL